ncbi:T9SS type A sorting domain-containing protein [Brumimicrobium glaciale]|uniref:T9SS type A sorting domain-containing protein n=1 Tax=Brumimicrobium glaciale TaxID=200475 RepID=A0A4Q4KNB0_9FLAO|nr:T9SS type A sorting domain-containing protein [Brumimicrobium glaciale]RYM34923.1 T9SS type A sorting domain-containing protein [Brumimicrobium glaciale]
MKKIILVLAIIPTFVFGQWTQIGSDLDGDSANDEFGTTVGLSADAKVLIVGAPKNDTSTGQVKVFDWNGTTWMQKGASLLGLEGGSQFGNSVDVSSDGNTILVGAPSAAVSGSPGYSQVYEWNGTAWLQKGSTILGENANILNGAGSSVSMNSDGTVIAIGASGNSNVTSYTGHVRIYEWDGSDWLQRGIDIDGQAQFDSFGASVSLNESGTALAVGAMGAGIGGECSLFLWNGSSWLQKGNVLLGEENNGFGSAVHLDASGNTLAVSAQSNALFGTGYVKVFSWDGASWNQKGSILEGEQIGTDFFGQAKLSADGNTLVAGAYGNAAENGYVKAFQFDGTDWMQQGSTISGEAEGDFFGFSVDISDDGAIIAAGATLNDANGASSGHVRVIENLTLSTDNISALNNLEVYPNPTRNIIHLKSELEITSYSIIALDGKTLKSQITKGKTDHVIDLTDLNSGIYVLVINTANSMKSVKIVKE